jgi:hypothetical protein
VCLTIIKAVILILKHATLLRLSNSPESALALVEQGYQQANIDFTIQQYLAHSPEFSVDEFANFIMATDICMCILSSVTTLSHQVFSFISVLSQN